MVGRCRSMAAQQSLLRPSVGPVGIEPAMAAGIADHVWSARELLETATVALADLTAHREEHGC
jgi:hypothetical protein